MEFYFVFYKSFSLWNYEVKFPDFELSGPPFLQFPLIEFLQPIGTLIVLKVLIAWARKPHMRDHVRFAKLCYKLLLVFVPFLYFIWEIFHQFDIWQTEYLATFVDLSLNLFGTFKSEYFSEP